MYEFQAIAELNTIKLRNSVKLACIQNTTSNCYIMLYYS